MPMLKASPLWLVVAIAVSGVGQAASPFKTIHVFGMGLLPRASIAPRIAFGRSPAGTRVVSFAQVIVELQIGSSLDGLPTTAMRPAGLNSNAWTNGFGASCAAFV